MDEYDRVMGEALKIEDTHGLNIRGASLAILNQAMECAKDQDLETEDEKIEYMLDILDDEIRSSMLGCDGHMSRRDIAIMEESCRELCRTLLEDIEDWEQITKILEVNHE